MGASKEATERIFASPEEANIARMTKISEDWYSLFNSLGICEMHTVNRFYHIDSCAELYSAATGIEMDPQALITAAERNWNMYKALNVREGFSRKDDAFPRKWLEPIRTADGKEIRLTDYFGRKALVRDDLEKMLDDYYDERGWGIKDGIPTKQKMTELGLDGVARDLSARGLL